MNKFFVIWMERAATWIEYLLAVTLLLCVVGFALALADNIVHMDWHQRFSTKSLPTS